jgi:Uma2 family endonuclease
MSNTNSVRSPDVSYIENSRLEQLSEKDSEGFYRIVPDFVIELRSDTDRLKTVIAKMEEYIENGVRLGWLIDPQTENVHIYRLNGNNSMQNFDETLSGEDVLPKFELNLRSIYKKK